MTLSSFWSVAQTETRREATAARFLADQGFLTYLPRIKVQKRVQPLFPSYLFVRIEGNRFWNIKQTIGVIALLTTGDAPARLRDNVIDIIKAKERGGIVRLPDPNKMRVGARVRIIRGSFEGHIALYQGQSSKDRERVLLDLLGRKVSAEVHKQDLALAPDLA